MNNFLITGASGFIGRNLCKITLEKGYNVKAIIRHDDMYLKKLGVECIISDLWEENVYKSALENVNIIIHCAGDATFGNGSHYKKSNSELTHHLIKNIQKYKPDLDRFIYISSIGAVDRKCGNSCKEDLNEESICYPSSDYGRSKLEAEEIVKKSKIPFSIVRPCMVLGKDMRFNSHFSVFIRSALLNSFFSRVAWPGSFSVIHVEDLARAILSISMYSGAVGKTYFCAGSKISIANSFNYCAPGKWRIPIKWFVLFFRPAISYLPFRIKALLLPALVASDEKLKKETDWQPRYKGLEVLNELIERERSRFDTLQDPGGQLIITGAASGLGRAFVDNLITKRKYILLIDKDISGLEKLKQQYPEIVIAPCDLTDDEQVESIINSALWSNRPISELYLCAGVGARGLTKDLDLKTQRKIIELNLLSRLKLSSIAYKSMKMNQFGRIVFVSSSTAFQPLPFMAVYAASNTALLHLGRAWAKEAEIDGVNIHIICPGGMDTNFQTNAGVKRIKGEKLLDPKDVVIDTMKGIDKKKTVIVISLRAKLMAIFARLIPANISDNLWYKMMQKLR